MSDRVAIISGAGRGVGRAAAIALAREGYSVALLARTEAELQQACEAMGGKSIAISTDVSNPRGVVDAVAKSVAEFGRLDAVVHCAGVAPKRNVTETSDRDWREVLDTNLSGAFYLARGAWPIFAKQRAGVIVNISSLSAVDPFPGFSAYAAAKAGLNGLGLALAREGEPLGIRVHTLALGAVETTMFRKLWTTEQWPTEKALTPDEVAQTIVQCVRGDLRYASGTVITLRKSL